MGNTNTSPLSSHSPVGRAIGGGQAFSSGQPMGFHEVHGENVRLEQGNKVARRAESFCKAIVFSSRPVQVNEKVVLRLTEISNSWSGALRLGFTAHDPATLEGNLPKYACPDLTNRPGNWAKALGERYAVEGTELHYYVNGVGEVFFGINGEEKGLFLNGVDTRTPLWALVDIYGNTTTIQMVDAVRQLNNHNELSTANRAGPLDADLIQRIEQLGVCLPEAAAEPAAVGPSADVGRPLPASRAGSLTNVTATPFPFSAWLPLAYHIVRGPNVRFSALDRVVAEREDLSRGRAFVFTSRTVRPNERLQVKVVGVDGSFSESLTFGLTTCNPGSLEDTVRSLPEDTDALYDRPEYWVFKKDLKCGLDDELVFVTGDDGRVLFSRNSGSFETVMHVDGTQQFYMFFNICGYVTKLRLVGTMRGAPVPSAAEAPEEPQAEPKGKLQSLMPEEADVDCRICFESPIESVLCNCGHSLTCHACGLKLLKGNSPQCPVCRQPIINVVRIYKA
ncbi:protein neuralized [Ixodes scapularis]|uniref:protein neuralized n=1 Tax=Ixodes scapularis TaxID=6945 RepID=UPI001A9FF824|nr:protein neuralized [Ixodes scapularis]